MSDLPEGNAHAPHSLTPQLHRGNYCAASPSLQRIVVKPLVPTPVYPEENSVSVTLASHESRFRDRLNACRTGMKQLDSLRAKHIVLMQDMRKHMNDDSGGVCEQEISRSVSPAPSCSISHRSSLSMDSGCASMTSSFTRRKLSLCSTIEDVPLEQEHLLACTIESTTSGHQPRPKSMYEYNYPTENTVLVGEDTPQINDDTVHYSERGELSLAVSPPIPISPSLGRLRDKRLPPAPPSRSPPSRCAVRPQSVAWMVFPRDCSPPRKQKQTTWEDVKRMLDPLFEVRQNGETYNGLSVDPHMDLSRSTSNKSNESNNSISNTNIVKREKHWQESESL